MDNHTHHEEIIQGFYKQFKTVFDNSGQAMYIYLDDVHKLCNKKFAELLGYDSAQEWASGDKSFTMEFVDEKSRHTLVNAYSAAMEKVIGSAFPVTWKTKTGKKVNSQVILVPVEHEKHLLALHFVQT